MCLTALLAGSAVAAFSCGGSADEYGGEGQPQGEGVGGGAPIDAGVDALPPEEELESAYGAPVATGRFVWIPNPDSGRVAYIDAETLEVGLIDAGHGPTHLVAVPDPEDDVALVLNVLSFDATLLRAKAGSLEAIALPVPSGGNALAVSADGRWAIAWTDASAHAGASPADGFQDLTVLDLTPGAERSTALSVGYRPVAVGFDDVGSRAFAVTQDGLGVIELGAAPVLVDNLPLYADPLEDVTAKDVAITPDGGHAVVRREGVASVTVLTLATGAQTVVALPAPSTDMDLSSDGSTAVAVVRDTGQVALLPLPGIAEDASSMVLVDVPGAVVGSASLASAKPVALLYTNATPSDRLTLLDLVTPAPLTVDLHAAVQAVFPTPDAGHALVLHGAEAAGPPYAAALTLAPLVADLPAKILGLEAPPIAVAMDPSGARALVATGGGSARRAYLASFPSLEVREVALASEPMAAGIVAGAGVGYVAQAHPDGRITFIDLATAEARTITGFELAAQVVDGSEP